jgi:hypothetical protein
MTYESSLFPFVWAGVGAGASSFVVVLARRRPTSAWDGFCDAEPCAVSFGEPVEFEAVPTAVPDRRPSMSRDTFFSESTRSLIGPNSLSFQYG